MALLLIDDALAKIADRVVPLPHEAVPLAQALGRFLAEPVSAPLDLPPFTNSAMDGYAIRAADTPGRLRVIGESAAGSPFAGVVGPGETVAISTGAVLPEGADAVARIEIVTQVDGDGGESIAIEEAVEFDEAIRHAGSDVHRGDHVLDSGIRIGPAQIGAAAALGLRELPCGRLPSVAVLSTGTELRHIGEALGPGQIYDSNSPMLTALLETAGATVTRIPAVADTPEAHREALEKALRHDVVITSGGVSVGPHDLVRGVGQELGVEEVFWRVALRPGKPLSFGVRSRSPAGERPHGTTLLFGLPGNPVSTLVCFELFVRPALYGLQGSRNIEPEFGTGILGQAIPRNPERDDLIRVAITADGSLQPLRGQQSHQITITAVSDGLARIPTGTGELAAGTEVAFLPLHGL
jgi:molybdopterin molybdotransferase